MLYRAVHLYNYERNCARYCTRYKFKTRLRCPKFIISDNGTAFNAVNTKQFVIKKGIDWKFNVAAEHWTGVFFEQLVACVQKSLKKVIGQSSLRFDELSKVILEVELMINLRPLISVTGDIGDEELTPNHLLFGKKLEKYPENSEKILNPYC